MPDKKQNPLIGAFRDPAPGVPPGPPASGEKKTFEPVQITMEVAPAGAVPQVKPPEPSKTEATPPKAADATPAEKAAEGKNPVGEAHRGKKELSKYQEMESRSSSGRQYLGYSG